MCLAMSLTRQTVCSLCPSFLISIFISPMSLGLPIYSASVSPITITPEVPPLNISALSRSFNFSYSRRSIFVSTPVCFNLSSSSFFSWKHFYLMNGPLPACYSSFVIITVMPIPGTLAFSSSPLRFSRSITSLSMPAAHPIAGI